MNAKSEFQKLNQDLYEPTIACSLDTEFHISWDFAEQVFIPWSSQQVVCIDIMSWL